MMAILVLLSAMAIWAITAKNGHMAIMAMAICLWNIPWEAADLTLGNSLSGLGTSLGELFPDNPCGFSTICPTLTLQACVYEGGPLARHGDPAGQVNQD